MKSTQSHLSYLIFGFLFLMSLTSWGQFDIASTSTHLDISCNGANDGGITLDLTNGTETKTVSIYQNAGSGWAIFTPTGPQIVVDNNVLKKYQNLPPGSYYMILTGSSGEVETSATYSIDEPSAITLVQNTSATFNPTCAGATNGQISISAYGGVGTYDYGIGGSYTDSDESPVGVFTKGAGSYTMSVRIQNSNGTSSTCTTTLGTITLTDPAALVFNGPVSATDVVCFGESNGTITVGGASGGTAGLGLTTGLSYGYIEGTTASGTPAASAFSFSENSDTGGLTFTAVAENTASTKSYYVAVQDANGCVTPYGSAVRIETPSADITISSFTRNNPSDVSSIEVSMLPE